MRQCGAGALAALWPLSEGTLLAQLLAAARGDDALGALAALLHLALEALPELSGAAGLPQAAGAQARLEALQFLRLAGASFVTCGDAPRVPGTLQGIKCLRAT